MQPQITNASVQAVVFSEKEKNYRALLEGEKELQAIAHRLRQLTAAVYVPATKSISQRKI